MSRTIGGVARLEKAFLLVTGAEDIAKQMRAARLHDLEGSGEEGRHHAKSKATSSQPRMRRWQK